MRLTDVTLISLRQLFRMRRRYAGPLTGAVLGSAALIIVMSVGDLVQKSIGSNLAVLGGATLIRVNLPLEFEDHPEDPRVFFDDDIKMIKDIPGAEVVAPSIFSWWPSKTEFTVSSAGKEYFDVNVAAVDSNFFNLATYLTIAQGRAIHESDVEKLRPVCVIGDAVREQLFGDKQSPLGKKVHISGVALDVIGTLGDCDDAFFEEVVFIPITVAKRTIPGMTDLRRLTVLPSGLENVDQVHKAVREALKEKRPNYNYTVWYENERVQLLRNILTMFNLFVHIAIVATLSISALGVANVMAAMVKERTAEIGLRKAVGATDWEISIQFLCESMSISVVGVFIGIMFASAVVMGVALLYWQGQLDYERFGLALLVALATGAISGVFAGAVPARMASRLDPVSAMKFE